MSKCTVGVDQEWVVIRKEKVRAEHQKAIFPENKRVFHHLGEI